MAAVSLSGTAIFEVEIENEPVLAKYVKMGSFYLFQNNTYDIIY